MKKIVLSIFALSSFSYSFSQCNELFISEYVEGTGNDKALEIYNPTSTAIDLSAYRLERFSNGNSTSSAGGVLTMSGSIASHDVWVIANGQTVDVGTTSPACDTALQHLADELDGVYPAPTYMNGNDAIGLFHGSTMIDLLGKIGDPAMTSGYGWSDAPPYDGSTGAGKIWTENHTLKRKASITGGVTANPATFIVTTEWDSLPENTWTGLGTHSCNCFTGISENTMDVSVILYPNPSANGVMTLAAKENMNSVSFYNILGQEVLAETMLQGVKNKKITTGSLTDGIYFVKIGFSGHRSKVIKATVRN